MLHVTLARYNNSSKGLVAGDELSDEGIKQRAVRRAATRGKTWQAIARSRLTL